MAQSKPLITISIPVYNEESNIESLLRALCKLAETEKKYSFEFLFTDNASTDKTFELLADLSRHDKRIRVLKFSRNFGFQRSILTNLANARGAAAVQLDADLQDPPALISEFLREWEKGYAVVYGIRHRRPEPFFLQWARKRYYRLVAFISEVEIPLDAGDFRLIDRVIIDHVAAIKEQSPYLRGYIANLGYRQKGITYDRNARTAGASKFKLFSLVQFGLDGIVSQSTKPLRLITFFGFGLCFVVAIATFSYLMAYLYLGDRIDPGFTTLVMLSLASIGINSFFLGMIGEYVGRVFNNTRGLDARSKIVLVIDHNGADAHQKK